VNAAILFDYPLSAIRYPLSAIRFL
jgi:hypothetical protein